MNLLLGLDVGTSHCKAGLFDTRGTALAIATRETVAHLDDHGYYAYQPDEIWRTVRTCIREVTEQCQPLHIACVGISSFAEAGLMVDRTTGQPLSDFIPWFDRRSTPQAQFLQTQANPLALFCNTGQHPNFKHSLAKLLWIARQEPHQRMEGIWLSAADYIAYRLTGSFATDPTLASRTLAYRIDTQSWDTDWIRHLGFRDSLFPTVLPSGHPCGTASGQAVRDLGLPDGIPVAVCGHDHICAAFAAGILNSGDALDSVGTAETLMGALQTRRLNEMDFHSGLAFGSHVIPRRNVWIGGLPAAGGSIEWLRRHLGHPPLSYEELQTLCHSAGQSPTGIFYFPYLSGAGAPSPNAALSASFIGISMTHHRGHVAKAVLEGCAYEMKSIQMAAESLLGQPLKGAVVTGGGTRFPFWLQVKADVQGIPLTIHPQSEATLLGAALLAGLGAGVYASPEEAVNSVQGERTPITVLPAETIHTQYETLYRNGYVPMNQGLRKVYGTMSTISSVT